MEKVDFIIKADYLLTMENKGEVIKDGAVAVKETYIIEAGTFSEVSKKFTADRILDGKDKAVFPGLVNTHTHAAMVYFRGLADDLPLMDWLQNHIWPAEGKWMNENFVSDAVELACLEMLKAGVTTYCDHYFFQNTAGKKMEQIGMRGVLGAGVIDFPFTGYATSVEDYFVNAENLINNWKGHELLTPCVAPHATYTCNPDNYKRANALSEKYSVPIHTHLAETEFEVAQCMERYGKTPVEHLENIGLLSNRLSAAHCVWLTDNEIELLAKRNVSVAHCIESNMKLASGFAPVPKMLKAGVNVALGTDGAASNNDLSILGEMASAAKVHKAVSKDPTVIDGKTVLSMATINGAKAFGLGDKTGSIKAGKKADLVIANLNSPHLTPIYDIYSHIAYCMRPSDIETVMVNGKILVENRVATTIVESETMAKATEWQEKIRG